MDAGKSWLRAATAHDHLHSLERTEQPDDRTVRDTSVNDGRRVDWASQTAVVAIVGGTLTQFRTLFLSFLFFAFWMSLEQGMAQ